MNETVRQLLSFEVARNERELERAKNRILLLETRIADYREGLENT